MRCRFEVGNRNAARGTVLRFRELHCVALILKSLERYPPCMAVAHRARIISETLAGGRRASVSSWQGCMYKAAPPFGVHSDRLAAIKDLEVGFPWLWGGVESRFQYEAVSNRVSRAVGLLAVSVLAL